MHDPLRDRHALVAVQFDGPALEVDQQLTLEDEEELVVVVMLVLVIRAVNDADPDDRCRSLP